MGLDTKTYWLTDCQSQCNTSSSVQFSVGGSHGKFIEVLWRLNVWIENFVKIREINTLHQYTLEKTLKSQKESGGSKRNEPCFNEGMTKSGEYWNILTSGILNLNYIENTVEQFDKLERYMYGRNA
jgi:hypothetical protein